MWWALPAAQLVSSGLQAYGQAQANRANLRIAREQMAFQERMSSTAYQRGMDDMRRAGLNPILAYQQGGASAPGGQSATMANVLQGVDRGVSSAVQLLRFKKEMELLQAQIDKTGEEKAYTSAMTANVAAGTADYMTGLDLSKLSYRARMWYQQWRNAMIQEGLLSSQRRLSEYAEPAAKLTGSTFGAGLRLGTRVGGTLLQPLRFFRGRGGLTIQQVPRIQFLPGAIQR